jgi:hypothetical protein
VLTTHPLLAPRSREGRAIPLPPSGLSNLLRVTFTFYMYFQFVSSDFYHQTQTWGDSKIISKFLGGGEGGCLGGGSELRHSIDVNLMPKINEDIHTTVCARA